MNERQQLLDMILAYPEDLAPRLIFADWLDEHNEEERAYFIREQCAGRYNDQRQVRFFLETLIPELGQWGLPYCVFEDFKNGFLHRACCSREKLIRHGPALVRRQPVLRWSILNTEPAFDPKLKPGTYMAGKHWWIFANLPAANLSALHWLPWELVPHWPKPTQPLNLSATQESYLRVVEYDDHQTVLDDLDTACNRLTRSPS